MEKELYERNLFELKILCDRVDATLVEFTVSGSNINIEIEIGTTEDFHTFADAVSFPKHDCKLTGKVKVPEKVISIKKEAETKKEKETMLSKLTKIFK